MSEDLTAALIVTAALLLLGVVFLTGHGAGLIAGYNTLPEAERERFDRRALCRFMGKMMFFFAGCGALFVADQLWPGNGLGRVGGIWIVPGVLFMLIYANTRGRFLKK